MPTRFLPALALCALPLLSGCIARTAASLVTAPVRVAGKAADMATTSQSEADENRGREIRHREERLGKLERQYQKHLRECDDGNEDSCLKARNDHAEMQYLMPSVPYEPK
ncbi:hypothetical protein SAMN05518801_101500 [Novosphingobium sp. CF614]|uniref:hypothetical protein n=1 Tax=Novosphingobium sp. CF614 TaxID=1884364 RepID=UPI0008EAE293|nr:hypothetical protein [Novosphingobium sp. CF614]SFF78410.1 hypothetical protein SAMN05518801_101500 [Novosphingobium sp. CF614]